MKIFKKISASITALAFAVMCFSGCSQGNSSESSNSSSSSSDSLSSNSSSSSSSALSTATTAAEALGIDISKYENIESKADLKTSNIITLNNSSVECANNCATVNGSHITITKSGTYIISGTLDDGQITVNLTEDENVYLVLKNANITCKDSSPINIQSAKNTYVIALTDTENSLTDGASYTSLDENSEPDACLFSKDDLIVGGGGTLNVTANYKDGIKSKDDLIISGNKISITSTDDGIVGKDSVAIVKCDSLTIKSSSDGIKSTYDTDTQAGNIGIFNGNINITAATDGIQAENSLYIENGTFNITTGDGSKNSSTSNDNWGQWGNAQTTSTETTSAKGLKANYTLDISGGTFTIDSSDDSVHSNDTVNIKGGTFEISSGDDGVHADTNLNVSDGTINITKCYEGLEASKITIDGGNIHAVCSDDGINAGGGDGSATGRPGENNFQSGVSAEVTINDGFIYIDSSGDGLDSNNLLTINGGTIIVNGPEDGGNSALDFDGSATISGGTLIAAGMSQMAQQPGSSSTQNNVMINLTSTQQAGTMINITDSDGKAIMSFTSAKSFNSIVYSSPELKTNSDYTINLGGSCDGTNNDGLYTDGTYSGGTQYETFSTSSVCTTVGQFSGMGGMQGGGGMQDGGRMGSGGMY